MKNKILTLLGIFLISLTYVSAETIYSGEEVIIPIDYEIVNCSITNSTNNLEGLNLSWSENNIIISTSPHYKSDNLTISCWVIKGKDVIEEHYKSSGGGGRGCITTWECSGWTDCINGNQTRNCSKVKSYCYAPKKDKPIEIQSCFNHLTYENKEENKEEENKNQETESSTNFLTGAVVAGVTSFAKIKTGAIIFITLIGILIITFVIIKYNLKH